MMAFRRVLSFTVNPWIGLQESVPCEEISNYNVMCTEN